MLERKFGTEVPIPSIIMMTVLRHPVGRFQSEYSWVTKGVPNSCASSGKRQRYAWDYVLSCNMSLSSFMQQEHVMTRARNRQTRMLAGLADFQASQLYADEKEMLDRAKQHLSEMAWFGIHEDLETSMWLLREVAPTLELSLEIKNSSFRRSTGKDVADVEVLKLIEKQNSLDLELYAYALQVFKQRVAEAKRGKFGIRSKRFKQSGAQVAKCVSGLCGEASVAYDSHERNGTIVAFGEVFEPEFLKARPECDFKQTQGQHMGTFSWYNKLFGCAFSYGWFQTSVFEMETGASKIYFSTRSAYSFENLLSGSYIVAFGAAQTMGRSSNASRCHLLRSCQVSH